MSSYYQVIQQACLGLPETEEFVSHSFPTFKAAGKIFATYSVNHHGDNKIALLLNIGHDMQSMLTESAPSIFFIPPYTGPKGWVGIELNQGLSWDRVAELTADAYRRVAPSRLSKTAQAVAIKAPTEVMTAEKINPLLSKSNQTLLSKIGKICLKLPEACQHAQFGNPCYKAGKKTFCIVYLRENVPQLQVWVGSDRQLELTSFDQRFHIPPYSGHNGWIDLALVEKPDWKEIESLLLQSYKHFALKRMITALEQ